MKISEKLKNFITKVRALNDVEYEYKLSQKKENNIVERQNKIEAKLLNLKRALLKINSDLENKKLSPLKRIILELKLDMIESKLEKQNAKLDIENFKEEALRIKEEVLQEKLIKIEDVNDELVALYDKRKELDGQISDINTEVIEEEIDDEQIFNPDSEVDEYRAGVEPKYVYTTSEEIDKILTEKEAQLKDIVDSVEEKEDELDKLKEDFRNTEKEMNSKINSQLVKYNPIRVSWESFKSFMSRATKTISNFVRGNKEKEQNELNEQKQEEVHQENVSKEENDFKNELKVENLVNKQNELADQEHTKTAMEFLEEFNEQKRQEEFEKSQRIEKYNKEYEQRQEAMKQMNEDVQKSIVDKVRKNRENENNEEVKLAQEDEMAENSTKDHLRNLVGEHNLAIRVIKYQINELEDELKKAEERNDQDQIGELKLKLAALGNDLNDHRRIIDERIRLYREQNNLNSQRELREDEKETLDNSVNKEIMEQILREGEKARQENIKKDEEEFEK